MRECKKLTDHLVDQSYLRTKVPIVGEWVSAAANGAAFDVRNPSSGTIIATLPDMGVAETSLSIDAAYVAQKDWAAWSGTAETLRSDG